MNNPIEVFKLYSESFGNLLLNVLNNTTTCDLPGAEEKEYLIYCAKCVLDNKVDKSSYRLFNKDYTFGVRLEGFMSKLKSEDEKEQEAVNILKDIGTGVKLYNIETCPDSEKWYWKNLGLL